MAFDGLFMMAMTKELGQLTGGRISKIQQPNAQELLFTIRAGRANHRLLISIHPSYSRVHLTDEPVDTPSQPPSFCMFLRKHLEGGIITGIRQSGADRIMTITVRGRDEIGDETQREIHVEVMGRHSNLILTDPERNLILDSLKHLPPSVNSYRTVLPGQPYVPAPPQDKLDPVQAGDDEIMEVLAEADTAGPVFRRIGGFSPLHAEELLFRTEGMEEKPRLDAYRNYIEDFRSGGALPTLCEAGGKVYFSANPLHHLGGETREFPSLSALLDKVFHTKAERDRVKQQAGDLERWLTNEIQKLRNKLIKLRDEQKQAGKLDRHQLFGELVTANLYQIQKGDSSIEAVNYYDEDGGTVTIPLDPRLAPAENAQRYYSKYNKAKHALVKIAEQLEKTEEDILYFEALLQQVIQGSAADIEEIRDELAEQGFMKARRLKKKKKETRPVPDSFVSSAGVPISVGKNNKQNDYLTFKLAKRNETWLHTKDIPGSHVVIHSDSPDDETIREAAALAAYFSKARESASVPVDYTEVRHVKKPNGSKPGFVIYFEQKTVFADPDEDLVKTLRK
ncbi:NFACT family protein [Bhargavaea ginsengi]|uniref:Rqc2 family fibronectin-binding protein n=1 Tax=Bhargavaea ginsengi TaxID=426757 RepID=UPI0020410A11|nr:NFACT RNA binding domain-containing protein [Bhargavaea ginsengi]MCM3087367.1 NFACT family protein [Bhargavaea ginsengi]